MWLYRVDNYQLAWQWALLQVGLMAGLVLLESVPVAVTTWRGHLAARIPMICGSLLILLWYLPIQTFLLYTLTADTWLPVLAPTLLGVMLGLCLPDSYLRLRRVDEVGRI